MLKFISVIYEKLSSEFYVSAGGREVKSVNHKVFAGVGENGMSLRERKRRGREFACVPRELTYTESFLSGERKDEMRLLIKVEFES